MESRNKSDQSNAEQTSHQLPQPPQETQKQQIPRLISNPHSQQQKPECLVVWVRHGELADQTFIKNWLGLQSVQVEHNFDPPLTQNGKDQAYLAGQRVKDYIVKSDFAGAEITILSSPMIRTLETAAYLSHGLTNSTDGALIVNNNLCVKLKSRLKKNPLEHGYLAMANQSDPPSLQTLIQQRLDNKISQISSQDPHDTLNMIKYPEDNQEFQQRFMLGFHDIIKNYFVKKIMHQMAQLLCDTLLSC
eukprot:403371264